MPLTTIDARTALVVIDLQKGIIALPTAHRISEVLGHAADLVAAFHDHDLPVVLVTVTGGAPGRTDAQKTGPSRPAPGPDWADLAEELGALPSDQRVIKKTWGAFHGTSLDAYLKDQGVTQIVLAGVSTSIGVETTARSAYEHGYHVVLATDAMTDSNADSHQNSVERIFPRLGETATSGEIIAMLPG